jgi:catechol 2,3-dioxygenase-like lactoylglutathione lyase family enzyme
MSGHQVKAMFHSTAMVQDYDATVGRLAELVGLRVLEYGEAKDPAIGRRGGMTGIGDNSLEIGEPIAEGAPPDRFVKRTGGGMQGVAVWVEDFAATVEHLEARGVRVPVRMPNGFGFSAPSTTGGLQFEWSQFTVAEDPRAGAPEPEFVVEPKLDVKYHAFVGGAVEDPLGTATHFEENLGFPIVHRATNASPGDPEAVVSLGDCVLALYRWDLEQSVALWGREHDRPGVIALGVGVANLESASAALGDAGVAVLREGSGGLVLDPKSTGDVGLVLVDRLLPGDPRS